MIRLTGKNILVVGLGMTGAAVAKFLKHRGAVVTVTDHIKEEKLGSIVASLRAEGIQLELGIHQSTTFEGADLVVLSPGVSHNIPPVKAAKERGVPVWGEIELASRFIREPVVAITGTNGKTTTTRLLNDMLTHSGLRVFLGGNIGNPLINYADQGKTADVIVVEVSSFQLDTIETFRPKVGVLLNITEDHLDRYPDFDDYAEAKIRLFKNQRKDDVAVLNGADPVIQRFGKNIQSKKLFFNTSAEAEASAVIVHKQIRIQVNEVFSEKAANQSSEIDWQKPIVISGPELNGNHNMENAAAACLGALAAGGNLKGIKTAINRFKGLPHRLDFVDTVEGVSYYDDSKATNVGAVIRALETFDRPVILIMGGQSKGGSFEPLKKPVSLHVKTLIAIGEAKGEILSVLGHACENCESAGSMEDAVLEAYRISDPGDVVLLSPACASFDMYSSYGQRGESFCNAVKKLRNYN